MSVTVTLIANRDSEGDRKGTPLLHTDTSLVKLKVAPVGEYQGNSKDCSDLLFIRAI